MSLINWMEASKSFDRFAERFSEALAGSDEAPLERLTSYGTTVLTTLTRDPRLLSRGLCAGRRERIAEAFASLLGRPELNALLIPHLASDDAAYVSGQTLTVDGGVINSVLAQLPRD